MKVTPTLSFIAIVVLSLSMLATPTFATDWSGNITTHVTWVAFSDITIVGSLTVTSTGWLTVEEGCVIDGDGTGTLEVQSGGKLEIGESPGASVTIDSLLAIVLDGCEGTTPITNTDFTNCGDPLGVDPFISLTNGEDDGYVFTGCTFNTIFSSSTEWGPGAKGGIKTCGWFQWAGSPVVIEQVAEGNTITVDVEDSDYDASTCGWFQWAGSPIVDGSNAGGAPCRVRIRDNEIRGYNPLGTGEGIGVRFTGALHDNQLPGGTFDIEIYRNRFYDLEVGIEIENGVEAGSMIVRNNAFFNNETGISVTSTNADPVLAEFTNNALFDNGVGAYISLNGNAIPDGLTLTNTVAWENEVGFDFTLANSATISDLLFRNNVAGESSTAGFRSNVTVGSASIHHMGLKGNVSNIKVGSNDGTADRFASDCVFNGFNNLAFSLVNENPSSAGWDFHLLVDDSWSGDYNNLINVGYGTDPDGNTADIGLFGGAQAEGNIDKDLNVVGNYRSVTSMEFFNNVTTWKPDIYRVNIASPSINMTSTGTVDGGSASYQTTVQVPSNTALLVGDNFDVEYAIFEGIDGGSWKGFKFTSASSIDYSGFSNCTIRDADYGLYLIGLDDTSGDRLPIVDCLIENCGNGVYGNQSRLLLSGTTITGSTGNSYGGSGIYLTSCTSGKVKIENCTITGNGTGGTYSSAGIYLSNSSPEIINTLIEDNSGAGVVCLSSTPDLNTWNTGSSSDQPNSIHSNGGATQSGSDGSEVYLASSSYPDIQYNNIWDYSGGPIGYMIYKHSTNNSNALTPANNWWGAAPTSSFFYWGAGSAIDYSTYSGSQLSSLRTFNLAMAAWEAEDFEHAADLFRACLLNDGPIGINSIHYLSGCYGNIPDSDYEVLETILSNVARIHRNPQVAKIAQRFATDCLTEMGEYDRALEEYQEAIDNACCESDAVMAQIDWLSVYDLAYGSNVDGTVFDIPAEMTKAYARLDRENGRLGAIPREFFLAEAYPNPFNSTARIDFAIPEAERISVTIHDLSGREIARIFDGRLEAGRHSAVWNADKASAGVYFVKIAVNGDIHSRKLLLVK